VRPNQSRALQVRRAAAPPSARLQVRRSLAVAAPGALAVRLAHIIHVKA
jgi:hypothetical protein